MNELYFIEVDRNGCSQCGHERSWVVIDPEGIASDRSYEDEDDAADLAAALNEAYARGQAVGEAEKRQMLDALKAYERLDDQHANCKECDGEVQPELCEVCFPFADTARLKMRAALLVARAEGKSA